MREVFEKQLLDWSRNQNKRIKSRGTMALFNQTVKSLPNLQVRSVSSRGEWPLGQSYNGGRYLTRKISIG